MPVQLCACDCAACAAHPQAHAWNECRMSSTFVTLAEVLEARGGPLQEEEVWSLLLGSAEALVDVSYKGKKLWATSFFLYVDQCNCDYCSCHWLQYSTNITSFFPGLNNMSNIISPASLLLSANGTLAFKNCGLSDEVSTFTAPEMLQGRASSSRPATERVCASIFKADLST